MSQIGFTVKDEITGLQWDRKHLENRLTWDQAQDAVNVANSFSHLGFNDWRLPSLKEMKSLIATFELASFPDTPESWFWTNETYWPSPNNAWIVCFPDGSTDAGYKKGDYFVRLVRNANST